MNSNSVEKQKIASGIRELDKRYFDYLYGLREFYNEGETLSLAKFVSEISENGSITMVFNTIRGKSLRNDIRREVNDLYAAVYENE